MFSHIATPFPAFSGAKSSFPASVPALLKVSTAMVRNGAGEDGKGPHCSDILLF
ncbi:hypothetical protein [Corynebacterium kroppenstedtii]|uniref:hypothetical protein n=1 Tax=Corynebacterium kroppenstedtii TaxID=161879 RepID=UPI0026EF4765|nr:hypothetical protein [Corynebacterium kroppenstedtii]